jgi:SAM-dependent methyltransferase
VGAEGHLYSGFAGRVQWFAKRFGWVEVFCLPLRILVSRFVVPFLSERHFEFRGEQLPCFYAHYNITWCNERAVEVPLARWYLEQTEGPVLEVGHVLGHYGSHGHLVLDKYENAEGLVNEDITQWQTDRRFELILSVSTFEHIGFDDDVDGASSDKIKAAIASCRALLQPGGRLVFTVPLGYNPDLDQLIESDHLGQNRGWFLLRHGPREWKEVAKHQVMGTRFGRPYPFANALLVAEFDAIQ